jgi:NAD-dependent deacetylase sirtuin 4
MDCRKKYPREEIQKMLIGLNPNWTVDEIGEMRPDGDVDIPDKALLNFRIPFCEDCGERSILKTDVVFFGDNVPMSACDACYEKVETSDLLLVLGSSLLVMSGYRFVHFAHGQGIPIAIVNIGQTRADHLARVKIESRCSEVLQALDFQ